MNLDRRRDLQQTGGVVISAEVAAEHPVGADWGVLGWSLLFGVVAALATLVIKGRVKIGESPLPAGLKYSFTDSWVTNSTAFVALVAAVGTASGKLTAIVDAKVVNGFSVTTVLCVALAGLAPLWYTAWQTRTTKDKSGKKVKGKLRATRCGLMGAAFLSVWGAASGIASTACLFVIGMDNYWYVDWTVGLIAAAICALLVMYALKSLTWAGASTVEDDKLRIEGTGVADVDGRLFLL